MNKVRLFGFIFLLGNVFSVLFAGPRVITLEGDVIEGNITGISNQGVVSIKDTEFTLDGIRSIVASGDSNQIDESEGRVVLICGTEFAFTKISLLEEEFNLSAQGLREKEQRQIVNEVTKKQDILLTDLGALAAEFVEIDILDRSSKERLANLQKAQKNLSVGVGNTVKRLKGMVLEIKNNRLEEEKGILQSRLNEKIIAPLELLTQRASQDFGFWRNLC